MRLFCHPSSSPVLRRALLAFSSLLFTPCESPASSWPEFRGPTGQGHSTATGLPTEWGPDKNMVWRAELPGRAWSSPVVAGNSIYVTNATALPGRKPEEGISLRVVSLDARTGSIRWDREVFQETASQPLQMHAKNSHASPTVVHADGRIYAHFGHYGTACLDESGSIVWSTQEHRYPPMHGTGGSPVLVGDLLVFCADGERDPAVVALDRSNGRTRWRVARPDTEAKNKFSFCTPLVIEAGGRRQIIAPGSGLVQALDPKDGSEIWRVRYGRGYSVVPRPVMAHGLLFLSSGFNQPIAYAIRPDGTGDVTDSHVAWTARKRAPLNPSMVVVGDELFMLADNGILSCLDARTGAVHYEERLVGESSASLLAVEGRLYAIDEHGRAAVAKAGRTFQILATSDLKEKTLASFAVCDSDLIIRTEKALYRVGRGTPAR